MNKILLSFICLLLSVILCYSQVRELEDVEVTGPSDLKSTLSKKPLLKAILPALVRSDSLPLTLPLKELKIPVKKDSPKHFFCNLEVDSKTSFRQHLLMAYPENGISSGQLNSESYSPHKDWRYYLADLRLSVSHEAFLLEGGMDYLGAEAPMLAGNSPVQNKLDHQQTSDNQIFLSGRQFHAIAQTARGWLIPATVKVRTDYSVLSEWDKSNRNGPGQTEWNSQVWLQDYLVGAYQLNSHFALLNETPLLYIALSRNPLYELTPALPLTSVSVFASSRRILPNVEFIWLKSIAPGFNLLMTQKPEYHTQNMFSKYINMPWQNNPNELPLIMTPLNLVTQLSYKSGISDRESQTFSGEYTVRYTLDEPGLSSESINSLPAVNVHQVWQTSLKLSAGGVFDNLSVSQDLLIQKGWYADDMLRNKPYLPLYVFTSSLMYKKQQKNLQCRFEQDYGISDERGELLRAALVVDIRYTSRISRAFEYYIAAENVLSRGKIIHSFIPAKPFGVHAGISWLF